MRKAQHAFSSQPHESYDPSGPRHEASLPQIGPQADLAALELGVTVEHLLRARVPLHRPVENRRGGYKSDGRGGDPSPEHDRLGDGVALQATLHLQVEYLQLPLG